MMALGLSVALGSGRPLETAMWEEGVLALGLGTVHMGRERMVCNWMRRPRAR